MDKSKKVWLLKFCEGTLDGLTHCYLHGGIEGYRLLWNALAEKKNYPELEKQGVYFIIEKKAGHGKPHIYVGQASTRKNRNAMLNRIKEHRRRGEFGWADDVVFLLTPDGFGSTELNYLENRFYAMIQRAGGYCAVNASDPHAAEPREEIMWRVEAFVEDVEAVLAIFGHRPFIDVRETQTELGLEWKTKAEPSPCVTSQENTDKGNPSNDARMSAFSFEAVQIPVGAKLVFTEANLVVTVADAKNKVEYKGKIYSLTKFVREFHPKPNASGAYQGPKFFEYNGELLTDIRKRLLSGGAA